MSSLWQIRSFVILFASLQRRLNDRPTAQPPRRFLHTLTQALVRLPIGLPISLGLALGGVALSSSGAIAQTWHPVYDGSQQPNGILFGVSGMAAIEGLSDATQDQVELLIDHDNKNEDSGRFAIVQWQGHHANYIPLNWASDLPLPIDLEALTAIPGGDNLFVAMASNGDLYKIHLDYAGRNIHVLGTGKLPPLPDGSNLEGLALTRSHDQLIALWGHRGLDAEPGQLYWGAFDPETLTVTEELGSIAITVPHAQGNLRHISDITVTPAQQIIISSAIDGGNDGPFASIVYEIGTIGSDPDTQAPTVSLYENFISLASSDRYKIEAITLDPLRVSPALILGTDDENLGSMIGR